MISLSAAYPDLFIFYITIIIEVHSIALINSWTLGLFAAFAIIILFWLIPSGVYPAFKSNVGTHLHVRSFNKSISYRTVHEKHFFSKSRLGQIRNFPLLGPLFGGQMEPLVGKTFQNVSNRVPNMKLRICPSGI